MFYCPVFKKKKRKKKNNVNITEMNSVIPSLFFKMTGK